MSHRLVKNSRKRSADASCTQLYRAFGKPRAAGTRSANPRCRGADSRPSLTLPCVFIISSISLTQADCSDANHLPPLGSYPRSRPRRSALHFEAPSWRDRLERVGVRRDAVLLRRIDSVRCLDPGPTRADEVEETRSSMSSAPRLKRPLGSVSEVDETDTTGHGQYDTGRARATGHFEGIKRCAVWEEPNVTGIVQSIPEVIGTITRACSCDNGSICDEAENFSRAACRH